MPLESLEVITSYYTSVGHGGSEQTLFYCEVTDSMLSKEAGGGNQAEGELIDIVYVPLDEAKAMTGPEWPKTASLCFAFTWFELYKKPLLEE